LREGLTAAQLRRAYFFARAPYFIDWNDIMTTVTDWADYALKQRKFERVTSPLKGPQITHRVSKSFEGEHKQDYQTDFCESPLACGHMHYDSRFDCNSLRSADCDSKYSQEHLFGKMAAGYIATFGHDEAVVGDPRELFKEPGYFTGDFALIDKDKNPFIKGVMDGMCNVGIVREPLWKPVEKCLHYQRFYGRLHADVELPKDERGFLIGVMAFDVEFNPTSSYLGTKFVGSLEGMLIRHCEKEA
jgi:hypothetical protein